MEETTKPNEPNSISVPLKKEITAHGEQVKELVFREPTPIDMEKYGLPVRVEVLEEQGRPKVIFDTAKMSVMMSALAAVPLSTIRAMNTKDWTTCAYALAPFFLPDAESL